MQKNEAGLTELQQRKANEVARRYLKKTWMDRREIERNLKRNWGGPVTAEVLRQLDRA